MRFKGTFLTAGVVFIVLLSGTTSYGADPKNNSKAPSKPSPSASTEKQPTPKEPPSRAEGASASSTSAIDPVTSTKEPVSGATSKPAPANSVTSNSLQKGVENQSTLQSTNSNKPVSTKANQSAKALKKDNENQSIACTGSSASKDPCSDFIVVFNPASSRATANSLITKASGRVKREFSQLFNGALVNGPLSKMQALANNPNFLVVEDDLDVTTFDIQQNAPWGLDRVDQRKLPLDSTFNYLDKTGIGTSIFVIDTGIDATNSDFNARVQPGFTAISDGFGSGDCNGHGTHVAGIAAGAKYGIAKGAQLVPVRVLGCDGSGTYSNVISGLEFVAGKYTAGAKFVVNMSLGGPASSTIDGAVQSLISKGVHVVVAAGNSNANACNYSPARVPEAITVGATTTSDSRAGYSNFGSCLDLFAPGSSITSTWLGSAGVNTISGTSMAAPAVAGVIARFLAANGALTPAQVSNSVKAGSTQGLLTSIGSGSPNSLAFIEFPADLISPTEPVSPTFKRINPVGKSVGRSVDKSAEGSKSNPAGNPAGKTTGKG
jgi:subtilisin family serine protease